MSDLKAKMLGVSLREADVQLRDDLVVRIREITRAEMLALKGKYERNAVLFDQNLTAKSLVEPELSVDEVAAYFAAAPLEETEKLSKAIARLNGWHEDADKEVVSSFPEE
jgi:hypothetical protein